MLYVVASTAVLPYSDDGASGEGLQLECVRDELEAVATAVRFMNYYANKRMFTNGTNNDVVLNARRMCLLENHPNNFDELNAWFHTFLQLVEQYAQNDAYYNNPNCILNVEIKCVYNNKLVFPCQTKI